MGCRAGHEPLKLESTVPIHSANEITGTGSRIGFVTDNDIPAIYCKALNRMRRTVCIISVFNIYDFISLFCMKTYNNKNLGK